MKAEIILVAYLFTGDIYQFDAGEIVTLLSYCLKVLCTNDLLDWAQTQSNPE